MNTTSGGFYWRGVVTQETYQFKALGVPASFVDNYGNPKQVVSQYTNPQGITEDLVLCLPYGGVLNDYSGPPSVINPPPLYVLAPGHTFSPWSQELEPGPGSPGLVSFMPMALGVE